MHTTAHAKRWSSPPDNSSTFLSRTVLRSRKQEIRNSGKLLDLHDYYSKNCKSKLPHATQEIVVIVRKVLQKVLTLKNYKTTTIKYMTETNSSY